MRSAIFIPAYEAATTLERVVRRIPRLVYDHITEILIQDDASTDTTVTIAQRLTREFAKITVVKNEVNLGYGGTNKKAFFYFLRKGIDAVVMLHGDLQHPPEYLPVLLAPIEAGTADIVLGSRILGNPISGGMPLYKWVGNRFLTVLMNRKLGLHLTDYHTGYLAYACGPLARTRPEAFSNGHELTAELLISAVEQGLRIAEAPVPTYYGAGSRSCSATTSTKYGLNVLRMLRKTPRPNYQQRPQS